MRSVVALHRKVHRWGRFRPLNVHGTDAATTIRQQSRLIARSTTHVEHLGARLQPLPDRFQLGGPQALENAWFASRRRCRHQHSTPCDSAKAAPERKKSTPRLTGPALARTLLTTIILTA